MTVDRLDIQFPWAKSPLQSDLRRLMNVLEPRFNTLEGKVVDWEAAVDAITTIGLQRLDTVLGPLLTQLDQAAELGFLVAAATGQAHTLVQDTQLGLLINSDGKELFKPTPWLCIMDNTDSDNWGIAQLDLYIPATGELTVTVKFAAIAQEGSDWIVSANSGVWPAMQDALADAIVAQTAAEDAVATVNTAMATLQDLIDAIESGPVASVAGRTGIIVLAIADVTGLQAALDAKALTSTVNTQVAAKQDASPKLSAIANATWAANQLICLAGTSSVTVIPLTDFIKTLLDDADAASARTTLGITAPTAASDAEIHAASGTNAIVAQSIASASAAVALTDGASIALNWASGINFTVTLGGNRTLANPTNGQPGTTRTVLVQGNSATARTLLFGNQYLGSVPVLTDCTNAKWYLLTLFCVTATHFVVTSVQAK